MQTRGTRSARERRKKRSARNIRKERLPRHYAIAFREAGHAVAAWERGVMLMPLSIFAVAKGARRNVWNDPLRNVDFDWVRSADSPALARRLAAILIAGPVAQGSFGPALPRGSASSGRVRDAKALLRAASGDSAARSPGQRNSLEKALAETERFLKRRRVKDAVTALAEFLVARGTVRGGEAASIIERHLRV